MHPNWTEDSTCPGASDSAIAEWNKRHQRELPAVLTALLRQHDGGVLQRVSQRWKLKPLAQINEVNTAYLKEVWKFHDTMEEWREELEGSGLPADATLYPFATDGNTGYWFAWLQDAAEPVVIWRHGDDFEFTMEASLDAWCRSTLVQVPAAQPGVVWDDVRTLEVIFAEKCLQSGWVQLNQVLGRKDGKLWLYTHELRELERELVYESYTRYLIPEPLDSEQGTITRSGSNWSLTLTTIDTKGRLRYESERNGKSAGWMDAEPDEGPGTEVESPDRAKIEALRVQLIGRQTAAKDQS